VVVSFWQDAFLRRVDSSDIEPILLSRVVRNLDLVVNSTMILRSTFAERKAEGDCAVGDLSLKGHCGEE
jgi:hypothetical protein